MTILETQFMEAVKKIAREVEKPKRINWEQRRYEIAKEYFIREVRIQRGLLSAELIAEDAVAFADVLIAELMKPTDNKC